jgi:eukaryotic-like serine/threonine-protein kinase
MLYTGSQDSYVYALDLQRGAVVRKFKTGGVVYSTPTILDGVLYVGSYDKHLYAFDV